MIRTLKITTILAAVVCVCLVGFVGAFGLKGDPAIEAFLAEDSFVDGLKKVVAVAKTDVDEMSPLVRQAQLFARRINPPPPPKPPEPPKPPKPKPTRVATRPRPPEPPRPPSAKFDVIAVCRYEDEPDKSLALLDLPAKGLKWVRVNERVEHLVVAEITDEGVIMSDNGRTQRLVPIKKSPSLVRSLLAEDGHTAAPATTEIVYSPVTTTPDRVVPRGSAYVPPSRARKPPVSRSPISRRPPIPGASSRQPRTYVPSGRGGSGTPRKPLAPSPEERKAILDDNISDIRQIMARPNPKASEADQKAEKDALSKLLKLLEDERQRAAKEAEARKKNTAGASKTEQPE